MSNIAHINSVLAKHTAFASFADLVATHGDYVPTMDLRQAPALFEVAMAFVAAGRDAYLKTPKGAVFAKALATKAPEALAAEFGIVPPPAPRRRLRGTVFMCNGEKWKADRATTVLGRGYSTRDAIVAHRWNKTHERFNARTDVLHISEAFVFENEV